MENFSAKTRKEELFQQWCNQTIDDRDIPELMQFLHNADENNELQHLVENTLIKSKEGVFFTLEQKQIIIDKILQRNHSDYTFTTKRKSFKLLTITSIAASLLILFFITYFLQNKSHVHKIVTNDIAAPTHSLAYIITENGKKINIADYKIGTLVSIGNMVFKRSKEDWVILQNRFSKFSYNTIIVPKGSKPLHLQLMDSTSIVLNVESSITLPNTFSVQERKIVLQGEAYFEVKHDPIHPFIVRTKNNNIKVLGTHFNVKAYSDDKVAKVTLTEGKVNVDNRLNLKPGQQAISEKGKLALNQTPDMDEELAWKNNEFVFNNAEFSAIISELSKWYNFEIHYQTKKPEGHYTGTISKNSNLSNALKILESESIHIKIENNQVIIN